MVDGGGDTPWVTSYVNHGLPSRLFKRAIGNAVHLVNRLTDGALWTLMKPLIYLMKQSSWSDPQPWNKGWIVGARFPCIRVRALCVGTPVAAGSAFAGCLDRTERG